MSWRSAEDRHQQHICNLPRSPSIRFFFFSPKLAIKDLTEEVRDLPLVKLLQLWIFYYLDLHHFFGTRCWWRSWLRHCATSRKVASSVPNGVIGIFHWHNPSGRTVALGLTRSLTEMNTRNISWGKGGRCVGLTTLPSSCVDCLEICYPQRPGTLWGCPGL